MTYKAPVREQLFTLEIAAGLSELVSHPRFAHATPDLVEAIVTEAGLFAEREYAPLALIGDRVGAVWQAGEVHMPAGFAKAYAAFVENGWGTLSVPEELGGQGLPQVLATLTLEDLGTANMGFSLINMLTPGAVEALAVYGSENQKARWLPKLINGAWNGTMNLTEPQAGSDVGALRTMATPVEGAAEGGLWKIKGQKIFITFGEHDLTDNIVHLVLARTPGAPEGTKGISLFLVPKYRVDAEGNPGPRNDVRCVSIEHKLGIHASPTCVMAYGDEGDCLGELVGPEGGGMRAMFAMMNNARLNVGSQGVQVAERATQQATAYALERLQSPRADGSTGRTPAPIAEHPDVRRILLRMAAQTEAARALVYHAAGQIDRAHLGDEAAAARLGVLIPLVKAHGTDIGCEVASLGIQVHGGMGFIEETGAARHLRDARIAPIYEGTNGIQAADLVGRKLTLDNGAAIGALISAIGQEAQQWSALGALAAAVSDVTDWMLTRDDVNDRLAGSYPYLTMLSVMVCGGLMAKAHAAATIMLGDAGADHAFARRKLATTRYYLDVVTAEALGLGAAAKAGSAMLYDFAV